MALYEEIKDILDDKIQKYCEKYKPPKLSIDMVYSKPGCKNIVTDYRGVK